MAMHDASLINVLHIDLLVEHVYSRNKGHIWLINNDLRVLENGDLFKRHYLQTLARQPYQTNIQGIWHVFGRSVSARFRRAIANENSIVASNLRALYEYNPGIFGKLRFVHLPDDAAAVLKELPLTLYTIGDTIISASDNNGIAIARPPVLPFGHSRSAAAAVGNNGSIQVGVSWWLQPTSEPGIVLRERIDEFASRYLYGRRAKILEKRGETFSLEQAADVRPLRPVSEKDAPWGQARIQKLGIVCALHEETTELIKVLHGHRVVPIENRVYHCGFVGDDPHPIPTVIRTADRMGNVDAAIATVRLLADFKPSSIILIGICAGVKGAKSDDGHEIELADVVVASHVLGYEYEKTRPEGKDDRWRDCRPDGVMINVAQQLARGEWGGRAWVGAVLAGEKVMNDENRVVELAAEAKNGRGVDAYGVEMESFGFGSAVSAWHEKVDWVMIKGVSDWASKKETDSEREKAKDNARAFLLDLLRKLSRAEESGGK